MKLRKCICGETPKHYPFDDSDSEPEEHSIIYCPKCDLSTLSYWNGNLAMTSWNKIIRKKLEDKIK